MSAPSRGTSEGPGSQLEGKKIPWSCWDLNGPFKVRVFIWIWKRMEDTVIKGGEGDGKEKGRDRRGSKYSENVYEDRASRGNF